MAQQVCPLCSANIEGDDPHIYKHFKYKRFDCGDKACTSLFYTETERNAHCSETKHKRSFQKTVNPYMEQMIAMIVEDAKELATEDMETVCKNRFEAIKKKKKSDLFKKRVIPTAPPSSESAPGTSGSSATSPSETPSAAKKRNNEEASTSTPATKRTKSGAASSPATSSNNSARRSTDNQPTPSPTSQPTSSAQEVVDSTTTDTTPPVPKQPRKKRDSAAAGNSSKADEDAAALERIAGVGDDYSSDKRELVKVACEQCKQEIPYLYFLRKQHVIVSHLKTISEDDEDHEEICKAEMDRCFPDGPNSKLACQACNDNKDVSANRRREHIEYNHYSILPELKCPLDGCVEVYKRQCDLAGHMKAMHNKMSMSRCKDKKFQESRARRNRMIDELKRRCFPWSEVEENAKMIAKTLQAPEKHASGSLQADIRLAEAGKTRRAPQYQYGSDDSSSDDDDGESTPSVTADADESTTDDQPINQADLEIIEVFFNKAINNQITRPVQVKQEPADDVAEGDVSGGVAPSAPSAPSAPTFRVKQEVVEEEPKQEEISSSMHMHSSLPPPTLQTHRLQLMHPPPSLHDSSFMSQYQPIVPPPLGSPESMSSPIMLPFYNARILSPVRAPERQETPSKSRSPSRSFRERVTYDSGRGNERGRRYNSRQNESTLSSSYSNNRPYNSSYRPPSSRGSHHLSSSYHSNSSYQRPPFRQRNYSNDGNRNRPNHPSRGYNNISSHPSSSSNYPRRDNDRRY